MKIIITKKQLKKALLGVRSVLDGIQSEINDIQSEITNIETTSLTQDDLVQYLLDSVSGISEGDTQGTLKIDLSESDNSTSQFITLQDVNDALADPTSELGQIIDSLDSDVEDLRDKLVGIDTTVVNHVNVQIAEAIAGLSTLSMVVVDEKPSDAEAETNVFYLVLNTGSGHYDIYAKIDGHVELLDDTGVDVDLSQFVKSITTDLTGSTAFTPDNNNNILLNISSSVEQLISNRLGSALNNTTVENWVTSNFVEKESGKSLVSDSDISKLNSIESGAEANVIEKIQKNGTDLIISNKTVNVEVPTKISDLTNDAGFVTPSDVEDILENGGVPASGIEGIIDVSHGGTGKSSFTSGNFLIGNGIGAIRETTPETARQDIKAAARPLNVVTTINQSDWSLIAGTTTYKSTISLTGCTSNHYPYVSIEQEYIDAFGIDSQCESVNDGIEIYAETQPDTSFSVSVLAILTETTV